MTDIINSFLPTLEHLGALGYGVVFLVAFLESIALVGSIIPGSSVVIFAGVLAAKGYFGFFDLIWFVALGAILGDSISYYLGTKGTKFFRNQNRFLRLSHLERGKIFFARHGPKSLFLGRFIAPVRAIVPFIAGLSFMNQRLFLFWNVLGGFAWAIVNISLGYFFGGVLNSVESEVSRAGLLVILVVVGVLLIWILVKKSGPLLVFIKETFSFWEQKISTHPRSVAFAKRHPYLVGLVKQRFIKTQFTGLPLTSLSLLFVYVLVLFLGIIQEVVVSDSIVSMDLRFANLLFVFRDADLVQFFLWITVLGKWQVVLYFGIISSILLWLWRKQLYIIPLWVVVFGSQAVNFFGKITIHRPRPDVAFYAEKSFSFPSGHATIALAFYGFLAYILWQHYRESWKKRTNILFFAAVIIFGIGFSRLYLGVHFFSDVWGGYLLGLLWLLIGISVSEWLIATEKAEPKPFLMSPLKLRVISGILIVSMAAVYIAVASQYKPIHKIVSSEKTEVISGDVFKAFSHHELPYTTETLLGNVQGPINTIVVADDAQHLVSAMTKAGWFHADVFTAISATAFLEAAFTNTQYPTAPLSSLFWNNKTYDLGFQKPTESNTVRQRHYVRFWKTNLQTSTGKSVYVASAGFDKNTLDRFSYKRDVAVDSQREYLLAELRKAGVILSSRQEQMTPAMLSALSLAEREFPTDGKLYVVFLNSVE